MAIRRQILPLFRFASFLLFFVFLWNHYSLNPTDDFPNHVADEYFVPAIHKNLLQISIRNRLLLVSLNSSSYSKEIQAIAPSSDILSRASTDTGNGTSGPNSGTSSNNKECKNVTAHLGYSDSCAFVRANDQCQSGGLFEYVHFFFCSCAKFPWLGYVLLVLWSAALFYMLGNTAADYFCSSLEKLSQLLHLPPTVAGVTLLPLGNGAPDVFASIAAFVGAEAGEVGLNSVLGGAVFVSCVVAGLVCLLVSGTSISLDRGCFIRDISFFLFTLFSLFLILLIGRISVWGSLAYLSIYLVYAIVVAASEILKKQASRLQWLPMLPILGEKTDEEEAWYSPLVDPDAISGTTTLPQWMWSHVAIYSHQTITEEGSHRPLWGWSEQQESQRIWRHFRKLFCIIDLPLTLPRQLTIPVIEENRWSKVSAVASASLAPVLLALVLNNGDGSLKRTIITGASIGLVLGILAATTTRSEHPPRRYVFPWVFGGFFMSIVWFYIIAKEMVAVLVSLGVILEVDASILGLTVLAWANSMGDLMANTAMARNGGDGVQIAMSGCYAGPMFNTLIGLGMSLFLASWHTYPSPYVVPKDESLFYTLAFLAGGLLWTLAILPMRRMRPNRTLGVGLLILYSSFLFLRMSQALDFYLT